MRWSSSTSSRWASRAVACFVARLSEPACHAGRHAMVDEEPQPLPCPATGRPQRGFHVRPLEPWVFPENTPRCPAGIFEAPHGRHGDTRASEDGLRAEPATLALDLTRAALPLAVSLGRCLELNSELPEGQNDLENQLTRERLLPGSIRVLDDHPLLMVPVLDDSYPELSEGCVESPLPQSWDDLAQQLQRDLFPEPQGDPDLEEVREGPHPNAATPTRSINVERRQFRDRANT